jgi:hypothetical protein
VAQKKNANHECYISLHKKKKKKRTRKRTSGTKSTEHNDKGTNSRTQEKQGVCHTSALPFTLKSILRQKKNYGNSNISACKNIPNLQKIL